MYAIKVLRGVRYLGTKIDGWISAFGYTVANNLISARRFEAREEAETFALLLAAKLPHYIGTLEVVPIVAWLDKNEQVRFREEGVGGLRNQGS